MKMFQAIHSEFHRLCALAGQPTNEEGGKVMIEKREGKKIEVVDFYRTEIHTCVRYRILVKNEGKRG